MVDPLTLAAFVPAALALNLTPGADMMFCIGQGLRSGPRAAWAASAGVAVGGLVHVLIAGAGLTALLAEWPLAFDIIRWVGVAYLLWLAYGAAVTAGLMVIGHATAIAGWAGAAASVLDFARWSSRIRSGAWKRCGRSWVTPTRA